MARKPICPTPPSPSLVAMPGGGFGLGLPYLPCQGADHFDYTYVGEIFFVKKNFPCQNLCSGAFGGNIRPYRKQRARHGSPFLEPPPPSFTGRPCYPPLQSNFRAPFAWWAGMLRGVWCGAVQQTRHMVRFTELVEPVLVL